MAIGGALGKALQATKETKRLDFKEQFNPASPREWCEVIKDLVAMANSGGGLILVGLKDDGNPSGWDVSPVLGLDPAEMVDKISRYTGEQFDGFTIQSVVKDESTVACITVDRSEIPLVFVKPGTYDIGGGKQNTAFGQGTVYFRHGAKSEPGNSKDLRDTFGRLIATYRKSLLRDIRKLVGAPAGSELTISPANVPQVAGPVTVQIVDDESAQRAGLLDTNATHPNLQKMIIEIVNEKLSGEYTVNAHDILSVRKVHDINEGTPQFFHKPPFSSPTYSGAFADWLVNQYQKNPEFFSSARKGYRQLLKKEKGIL